MAAVTAATIIVAVSAATAPGGSRSEAAARWRVVDLGAPGYATAVNGRGQVVLVSAGHAFLWTSGKLRDLGSLNVSKGAVALNNHGEVVLTRDKAHASYAAWYAFLWRKGKLIDLGTVGRDLGGDVPNVSEAVGINDRGDALANSSVNQNAPVSYVFVWRNGGRTALTQPSGPDQRSSRGVAINQRGQVAGSLGDLAFDHVRAFLWSKGRFTVRTLRGRRYSQALALNDRGAVVGESYDLDANEAQVRTHAFLWQHGKIIDLGTLGGRTASATAINNRGQIVGSSATRRGRKHAFLWQHGKMTDLGSFTPIAINDRGEVLASSGVWRHGTFVHLGTLGGKDGAVNAIAINDRGQIVGSSKTKAGKWHAALWTPRKR